MTNSNPYAVNQKTQNFLLSLSTKMVNVILDNVANHYGITREEAYSEIIDEESEDLMEYITGKERSAIYLMYKHFRIA